MITRTSCKLSNNCRNISQTFQHSLVAQPSLFGEKYQKLEHEEMQKDVQETQNQFLENKDKKRGTAELCTHRIITHE